MESDAFGAQVMLGNDDDTPVYYLVESDIDVTEWDGRNALDEEASAAPASAARGAWTHRAEAVIAVCLH